MVFPFFKKRKKEPELPAKLFEQEVIRVVDIVAPAAIEVKQSYLKLGERLARTFFIFSYPRYLSTGWFSPIINLDVPMDISFFVHPVDTGMILRQLRKRVTEVQSEIMEKEEKGLIRDPILEVAYRDLETLRDNLMTAQERMFRFGLYLTVYGETEKELRQIETILRSLLESRLIYLKPALYQQDKGFISTTSYGLDKLQVHTLMNTGPLSSSFPFVSFDLSSNQGILYGVNLHNNSLVLFDRFSLENAGMVIFAKAGAGKTIHGDEKVLIKNKHRIQLTKIGPLIEKLVKKHGAVPIDKEIEGVISPPELKVYSFDKNLKGKWSKVTVAMRKKAPQEFYKIKTGSGREITTTGDHNMLLLKEGKVITAKTSEIKEGEFVPLPRKLEGSWQLPSQCIDYQGLPIKNHKLTLFQKGRVNIYLPANDDFLQLAGFITAKGTVKKSYVEISNTEKEVLDKIKFAFKRLNIFFYETFNKDGVDGIRTTHKKFVGMVNLLGGGADSKQKRVWPFIFNLDKEKIAQYLSAYFEGDGGVEKDHFIIAASSKSKQLISEIAYLLYYFGIIGRISRIKKKATNKRTYWRISISGQDNLRKFAEDINFVSQRKRKQLTLIVKKEGNTNVDLIPGLEAIFQEIYDLLPCQLHPIPEISEWKRGLCHPSPEHLLKVINIIEERIQCFKDLAGTFKALSELPRLATVIECGKNDKELNRALWKVPGQCWREVKNEGTRPHSINTFKLINVRSGSSYQLAEIKEKIHCGFKEMDLPIKCYHRSLQSALKARFPSNTRYEIIQGGALFVWQNYQDILLNKIPFVEERLAQLKILASSDLFWDPIVEIKKIKNKKEKYVYDLTVDNEVFLAGTGGMFVHNSYFVKLEILRSLMLKTDVIVIDPENEYQFLSEAVAGSFLNISLTSPYHINPFDLPLPREDERVEDVLRSNIINLVGLMRLMLGGLTPEEDAIIDRALAETYAAKDISPGSNPANWQNNIPLMQDLEAVLEGMEGAESLVRRLRKYTKGTFSPFFNQPSNISMDNPLVVFGIRDMEEELRPTAMFIILRYIWNTIRAKLKKRILVVDEAWWLMQTEDGASFLYGLAKRARKYWLGVTTITQDVGDFVKSDYGKPIIANSSLQFLMKQSPAAIKVVQQIFNLTEEEKLRLLEVPVGEGLFFAGPKHVAIRVVASYMEDQIITTAPEEVVKIREAKKKLEGS